MTLPYASIKNNKGMSAQVSACAFGDADEGYGRKTLYSLDIAGSHTAVKAVWASVLAGGPLSPGGFARHKILQADGDARYVLFKSMPLPNVHHYHIIVEPTVTAFCAVLTSQYGFSREEALTRLLDTHTLYPVLPHWGQALFEEGVSRKLIRPLDTFGMDWAYRVELLVGWDELFDRAARSGILTFPAARQAA